MADETKTETQPSFKEALEINRSDSQPKATTEVDVVFENKPEESTPSPTQGEPAPDKPEAKEGEGDATQKEETPAPTPQAQVSPPPENLTHLQGLTKAVIEERKKRQEYQSQLAEAQAELEALRNQSYYQTPEAEQTQQSNEPPVTERLVEMSTVMARNLHPDFDEKYAAFVEEAQKNPSLLETVYNARVPGEAAYQAGRALLFQKEHGIDPDQITKSIEQKVRDKIRAELEAEYQKKFAGQLEARQNTPTNILAGRSANGASTQGPDWRPPSFAEALAKEHSR